MTRKAMGKNSKFKENNKQLTLEKDSIKNITENIGFIEKITKNVQAISSLSGVGMKDLLRMLNRISLANNLEEIDDETSKSGWQP